MSTIAYNTGNRTEQTRVSQTSEMYQVYQDAHWQASV